MQANFLRYGDIYQASIYGQRVYVINSPQFAEQILLTNWKNFLRKGQAVKRIALSLGNGLISSNGEFWVRHRRMIQPAFKRESVGALMDVFLRPNVALRERWKQAARDDFHVDVTRDVSLTVLKVTLLSIFGEDYGKVAPQFEILAQESRNLEFAQTCNALLHSIIRIAEERRAARIDANDILGTMMRALDRDGKPMTDLELAREGLTLVIAGHETTASLLNWLWYLLCRHPQVQTRVFNEVRDLMPDGAPNIATLDQFTYTRQVIEEALRSYPPLWLMTRKTIRADWIGGYFVPAGTEIYISPYLLQRHPGLWQDPDRFDPDRFDRGSIGAGEAQLPHRLALCPFGAGPRNCIGEFFARVEIQVHLQTVVPELQMTHDFREPAGLVADVNLLSRDHFIMKPALRKTRETPPKPL
jgi:cytochrome P450